MKNKKYIQDHPNQDDKSGKPRHASPTRSNSSTNRPHAYDVTVPEGAETDYKKELLKTTKNTSLRSPKPTKQ